MERSRVCNLSKICLNVFELFWENLRLNLHQGSGLPLTPSASIDLANYKTGELTMRLSKSDILHAAMVGLTLVASAVAVPLMASGQNSQPIAGSTVQSIQQSAQ